MPRPTGPTPARSTAPPATVHDYLKRVPKEHRAALEQLRRTIKVVAPDATEVITYQMPGFRAHGRNLVSYAAFADHYSLFPMGLSAIAAYKRQVAPYLSGKSTLRFAFDKPLPVGVVRLIVKARLAENAARARRTTATRA